MEEWTKERYEAFREGLFAQAEPEFAAFQTRLLRSELPVIGLRTPFLRKTAKALAKDGGAGFLRFCGRGSYEERLLYGLVAAELPVAYGDFLPYCDVYTEEIVENWALCDVFCSSLKKRLKGNEAAFFAHIEAYLASANPWAVRVGLVAMLGHYLAGDYLEESLRRAGAVESEAHYVRMAQAWLFATAWAKDPAKTQAALDARPLEEWTYRKFVQKACESYRITPEDKARLRATLPGRRG